MQQYLCRGCGKQFPADPIAAAVDIYYPGMSYKQVAANLEKTYDVPEPSKATVHNWVKGYTGLVLRYLQEEVGADGTPKTPGKAVQTPVGDHRVVDDLVLRMGGRKYWCWNIMDEATRYILAVRISCTRNGNDAVTLFENAKLAAASPPQKITPAGLASYVDAVKAVFPGARHPVSQGTHRPSTTSSPSDCRARSASAPRRSTVSKPGALHKST